ncbi:MAG TPA: abhydrolase domain-containing 18 [Blastocatellia bacterium]|nr:abhydrolase domain-containing 18 [Blastocatellia bacterium]
MLKRLIHKWERKLAFRDNNRKVRPFEWGIEFLNGNGLGELPTETHSEREILFELNRRAIAESDRFFGLHHVPDFAFDGHWLSFRSPLQTPYEENNTVYARYFPVPEKSGARNGSPVHEVERARGRAVIVLPHWNAKGHEQVAVCNLLNSVGIAALRLSMPYHDRRMLTGFERADYMVSANLGRTIHSCRQAVMDVRAVTRWLLSRGYDRIGIVGTSIGSCIAFLTFIHEERLKAGVYIHVSSYFGDVVWEGISTAHVRRSLETALTREEVRQAWLAISPNAYINRLSGERRRGLFISGRYDLTFTPELSRLLFEECERHKVYFDRRIVPWGHYTMGRAPFKYYAGYLIRSYFSKHL